MKTKVLQFIADTIITGLEQATDQRQIDAYYSLGIWFNSLCIDNFNTYLK